MNQALPENSNRTWEVFCHLSALVMFVGIPFGHILGPLVIWLIKRAESPSVDEHGKEALNFQISLTLYLLVLVLVTVVMMFLIIGFLLVPLVIAAFAVGPLLDVIFIIIAAIKASDGQLYRYPFTIRFLN